MYSATFYAWHSANYKLEDLSKQVRMLRCFDIPYSYVSVYEDSALLNTGKRINDTSIALRAGVHKSWATGIPGDKIPSVAINICGTSGPFWLLHARRICGHLAQWAVCFGPCTRHTELNKQTTLAL
jgi:hypothetical protein